MNSEPLNEVKLKKGFAGQTKQYLQAFRKYIQKNQTLLKSLALTLIATVFFVGIYYADTWQNFLFFRQRWFGLACVGIYIMASYLLATFSNWSRFRVFSVWVQTNLLAWMAFAYFLRLSDRQFEFFQVNLNTGLLFVALIVLIFVVNYNLFGKNERRLWILLPQVILFALQGFSFLSLTGTYVTDTTSFSSDWLNIFFNLHPFFWLTLSAMAIAAISTLSLKISKTTDLLRFFSLFTFLMVQGILIIYLTNFIDLNLNLTYWNLALMTLIYWDYLDFPIKVISQKIEDTKYYSRLSVSTIYHTALILLVILAPQLQLLFS